MNKQRRIAVIGAGMAGIACARTLQQAGHQVRLFDKSDRPGGRMAALQTPFGSFDHGAQYFTVRDSRLAQAMATTPEVCKRWSAIAVRVLDSYGQLVEAARADGESHWVAAPCMDSLPQAWCQALAQSDALEFSSRVHRIERDPRDMAHWHLLVEGANAREQRYGGFDAVLLALPANAAGDLLRSSGLLPAMLESISAVRVAPCWSLMLAFPQAQQPGLNHFGPQWNAARSTHHRMAWLCRESSKPGRGPIERWTVQASAEWSLEHLDDEPSRVLGKMHKAFTEITGVRAQPSFAEAFRWRHAKTVKPLGSSHLWDPAARIGLAGDWCLGHRVEDAFVSGLELALAVA